jgi:hypothetical protein
MEPATDQIADSIAGPQQSLILARFPKQRPDLPPAYRQRYVADYRNNRLGQSAVTRLVGHLESWMHRQVARAGSGDTVLEIGAGTLNHLPYEKHATRYDVVEPFRELWEDSSHRHTVSHFYNDIRDIEGRMQYHRILSIAVLEHLTELPEVLARSGVLLRSGGTFAAGIPSEGALGWYVAWRFGTGTAYRLRTGMAYAPLMRHEHVNKAREIESLLNYFFGRVSVRRFPLPFFHLSFYTVLVARAPHLSRCESYLKTLNAV